MDLRLTIAITVGKLIALINKLTGTGATAAPGLYALKIDPDLVKKLTSRLIYGNIVISGTNGKTTTARLTANILSAKFKIIHNRQGSNLLRGIASTLISASSLSGKIAQNIGLWEVDEATLPEAIENTKAKIIVLLNLFRDQLDRYGEVDTVRAKWQKSLAGTKQDSSLILNADDPGISILAKNFKGKVIYFGVNEKKLNLPQVAHVADIRHCLNCGSILNYSTLLSAHMGHYRCPKCNFGRPEPQVSASGIRFNTDFSTQLNLTLNSNRLTLKYGLPGLYNVYNVLAASALSDTLNINHAKIKEKITSFTAAFGRYQSLRIGEKSLVISLVKNPAGANEVIRTISQKNNINILAILNDKIADGRDVSWIWDTNWEILVPKIKSIAISGTRCWDLAVRFKYAGFKLSKNNVYENINYSLEKTLRNLNTKNTLIVLPTYTAMLELQKTLSKLGGAKWHED
ncbi:DUF1727 domain-containing protein [Candidatus Curtissbacteria bacterium]|nr:DUF1727 domain-containing protein [Candidatus Curtissbacteria bacterium]